jgi:hypothetical protein
MPGITSDPDFGFILQMALTQALVQRNKATVLTYVEFVQTHWKELDVDDRYRIRQATKTALQRNAVSHNIRIWQAFFQWLEGNGR